MKYIKLFESFLNEELSPELKKRTYDAMMKIANDPNAIDNVKRLNQADNVMSSLSPSVENLRKELENHARKVFPDGTGEISVMVNDYGLSNYSSNSKGYVSLYVSIEDVNLLYLSISKDKYQKGNNTYYGEKLLRDRAFVNTLKKLIVEIQNNEIPGEEEVPSEPESVTPEGSIKPESINLGHDKSAYLD